MYDCNCLLHPFQNDPGTSQNDRVVSDLLSGATKIDARTLADLLDYFTQMSRHINFYDEQLNISNWQPFFQKSIPFSLSEIIKTPLPDILQNFALYNSLFEKKSSSTGLQLLVYFLYYRFVNKINNWHLAVKDSGLPIERFLEILIKDKLQQPLKLFISYTNAAVKWYGIKKIDFSKLNENPVWNLQPSDLTKIDDSYKTGIYSKFQQIHRLFENIKLIASPFLDSIKIISTEAEKNLEISLTHLKDELQKKHPPHLALLFVFLNIFRQLQNDLNGYTRKHLDFFYKDVLQIESRDAVSDKAHIIFEIQKQLDKYLLKKGLKVKDGKDNNKQEILFSLDDDIVVNKTEVGSVKTLFLNNQNAFEQTYVEGVYIADDSTKADGINKDFKDDAPKYFSTLGAKLSKYSDPETKIMQPYPNARLGFILASPVLYLQEGTRTVNISIACQLQESICKDIGNEILSNSKNCCNDPQAGGTDTTSNQNQYPQFLLSEKIFAQIQSNISKKYIYLNENTFKLAISKGIDTNFIQAIRDKFMKVEKNVKPCYCDFPDYKTETSVFFTDWDAFISPLIPDDKIRKLIDEIFKPETILSVLFSGEKAWVEPKECAISIGNRTGKNFLLTINASINADQPAITFYSKQTFNEDFNSTQPLVKIELNDRLKFLWDITPLPPKEQEDKCCVQDESCCLLKNENNPPQIISFYQFFRNIKVLKNIGNDKTEIDVQVCGLKNFIVQNDESLQDVNGPVYPFGTRPDIVDFDAVNPAKPPLSNANFIGPDFYIGSMEVFCKKWNEVYVNLNWKNKPTSFNEYYKGYLLRENYHDCTDLNDNTKEIYGLNECDFQINLAVLENGTWIKEKNNPPHTTTVLNPITGDNNRLLFASDGNSPFCIQSNPFGQTIKIFHNETPLDHDPQFDLTQAFKLSSEALLPYNVNSRGGFLRINLQNQDFLHKDYSYVLARQMMAFGRYPDLINGAVYLEGGVPQVFDISIFFGNIGPKVIEVASDVVNSAIDDILDELIQIIQDKIGASVNPTLLNGLIERAKTLISDVATIAASTIPDFFDNPFNVGDLAAGEQDQVNASVRGFVTDLFNLLNLNLAGIEDDLKAAIRGKFDDILDSIDTSGFFTGLFGEKEVIIPNEPWTPIISNMSLDYTATATIEDIDLIHLYPYVGTYKHEEIKLTPKLFPTFCDEGTMFLGLKNLVPGENLNLLFQLAEATSDSESDKQDVQWHYLDNNVWKPLRSGFEVLDDATENLTTSGIVKFALPANMTSNNTIMPPGMFWIKASVAQNSKAVSETIAILSQAIRVTFTNDVANDKLRLSQPLEAGKISKLNVADANVKSVQQPFESFGGQVPEREQQYYVRVSEMLRHKGRAIQKFDYERIALQSFPQLFKAKCINHSFALDAHLYKNDFPYSPGYIILAVIPDLNKLKAGNSFEPKVPVSILEKIEKLIRERTSPFVRFRAMNPRYEKINFCLRVSLLPGKDENYYKEKLKGDLRELLAPWAVGKYDKLTFGQCVYRSDIIRFLEQTDYVDFITDFKFSKQTNMPDSSLAKICPDTPRSILIAGDIEVCINKPDCEDQNQFLIKNKIEISCLTEKIPVTNYCNDNPIVIE